MSATLSLSVSPASVATADSCRLEIEFPLPNMCSICTEKFDGASIRVFDALPELCRNHLPLVWLTDRASPKNIAADLFAAYLRNPTFCAYRRVCTGCFEKSLAGSLDKRQTFASVRGERDPDITLRIRCPICSTNPEYNVAVEPTVWGELLTREAEQDEEDEQGAAAAIDVNDLCKHVSPQLARDIIDAVEREYVRRHQRVLNCPVNDCTYTQLLDEESDKRIKCAKHGAFCALCQELVADGSSTATKSNDDDGDGTVSAAGAAEATVPVRHQCSGMPKCLAEMAEIRNKSIRRCPHCFEAIERNEGCDDMFCTTCSRPFVWPNALCQQPALSEQPATDDERKNYDDMPPLEDVPVLSDASQQPATVWQQWATHFINNYRLDGRLSRQGTSAPQTSFKVDTGSNAYWHLNSATTTAESPTDQQRSAQHSAPPRILSSHEQISANIDVIMQATEADRQTAMMALLLADKDVTEAIFIAFGQRGEFHFRKDVELIVSQTNAPLDVALRTYLEKKRDIVESIMELTPIH